MKQKKYAGYSLCNLVIYISAVVLLASCDTYYFSQPQPADKKNVEAFPAELRGTWISGNNDDTIIISDNHIAYTKNAVEKIVKGAWPVIGNKGDLIYSSPYSSLKKIRYDSLNRAIDTVNNYLLSGKKIFELKEDSSLGKGYGYYLENDSLVVIHNDTGWIDLGNNAFLRRLDADFFVLNVNYRIMDEDKEGWWYVTVLEKLKNGSIRIWEPAAGLARQPEMFYTKGHNYYIDSKWTTAEMLSFIKKGYFDSSDVLVKKSVDLNK